MKTKDKRKEVETTRERQLTSHTSTPCQPKLR